MMVPNTCLTSRSFHTATYFHKLLLVLSLHTEIFGVLVLILIQQLFVEDFFSSSFKDLSTGLVSLFHFNPTC